MGAKGHMGKGNVDNERKEKARSTRGISSPSIIYLDSLGAKTKKTTNATMVFSSEERNPRTPKENKLYHLIDAKSQNIAAIQATLIELKEEKDWMSTIIKKHLESLVDATRMHSALLSYTISKHNNLVLTIPELVMHHEYMTIETLI